MKHLLLLFLLLAHAAAAHAQCSARTGESATLLLAPGISSDLRGGDRIEIITSDGRCAGSAVYSDTSHVALTAWGDDEMTEALDGLTPGEAMQFRIVRDGKVLSRWKGLTVDPVATYSGAKEYLQTEGVFAPDGIYLVETLDLFGGAEAKRGKKHVLEDGIPALLTAEVYPNPTDGFAELRLGLPSGGAVIVEAFDLLGRRLGTLYRGEDMAGFYILPLDLSGYASGLYIVRVQTEKGAYAALRVVRQ